MFLVFLLAAQAFAATQVRSPTGDNSQTGTWAVVPASPTTFYDKVDEYPTPDDSTTYIYCTALSAGSARNIFNFTAFTVPSGAVVSSLEITYRHRGSGGGNYKIGPSLRVGGSTFETDATFNQNSWGITTTSSYTTNPAGGAWTVDDINGTGIKPLQAFGVYSTDVTPNPYVTQVYAKVYYNVAPATTTPASITQYTDGSGYVSFQTTVSDSDLDTTRLKVEYSDDGGTNWYDPDLVSATPSSGTVDLNNANPYQIGSVNPIGTNTGSVTLTVVWNTKSAANGNGSLSGTDQSDIQVRVTPNDFSLDGTAQASYNFSVDNLNPATLTATNIVTQPKAGDTTVTLEASFIETNPNTNTFYVAINGGAYGVGTPGTTNTATPAAQAVAVGATLDGNDYVSKVKCEHSDDFGNLGTNESINPNAAKKYVKPYTPIAPTVSNPASSEVDIVVRKNPSETDGLEYAINVPSHGKYVQTNGTLGDTPAWQTIEAWGTKVVSGLTSPVANYTFRTKSRNTSDAAHQSSSESDFSPTASITNTAPIGGYTADNVIPAAQCTQSTDGNGIVTISFRVKDDQQDLCTLETFQYSTNEGTSWSAPTGGDSSAALSTGWTNNGGSKYASATSFAGTVHSFTLNTKHADVAVLNTIDQNNIRIRFTVNDGLVNSASPASSENFTVDNKAPVASVTTNITSRPNGGDNTVTLLSSFAESHPNTNTFYLAVNGGSYGAGTIGEAGTANPSAKPTTVGAALDGNDYVSSVECVHVDAYGNTGVNENASPINNYVKPYTPPPPTVNNPMASSVDVAVNQNASETAGLDYAIYVPSHSKYVQTDGTLGNTAAWQTPGAWGTKTVTGLTAPVSAYFFCTKSRNPNGDKPESDLSGVASSSNTAPLLNNGTTENMIPILSQAIDGSGKVTIPFRIKDLELNNCSVLNGSFQYQVNGTGWNDILDVDITGTKTGLSSAADLSGSVHTLIWDTSKEYIDDAESLNVQVRLKVNDGTLDSTVGVSPTGFNVDNLDPAPLSTTEVYTQPQAGDTSVTVKSSFTEINPNTNTFYVAINGGAYGAGAAGETNTADPSPKAVPLGVTLKGSDYVSKVKCVHIDDFGNEGANENLNPDSAKKFVKPFTPPSPSLSNATSSTVDIRVNQFHDEAAGLEYAIYVSSHSKYVQSDGALGDTAAWQTVADWGTKTAVGLTSVANYVFKTKSRNSSDAAHQTSSESDFSDGISIAPVPPTPEGIVSYYPPAGASGISPESKVIIVFNRDMNQASVQNAFSLKAVYDNRGNVVNSAEAGSFSWPDGRTFTFIPDPSLSKGYTYRASLSGSLIDSTGSRLNVDLVWSFRVVMERQVQNVFYSRDQKVWVTVPAGAMPDDGSIDFNRDPLTYPKEVDPNSIAGANNKILAEGNQFFHPIDFYTTEINAYRTDGIRFSEPFNAPVTLNFKYDVQNGFVFGAATAAESKILERGLLVYRLDEEHGLWVKVPGSTINSVQKVVSAGVPHFSVYTLMATPAFSLADAYAFPNPFKPSEGHTQITFTNLASICTIKIFTLTGDLVKTMVANDGSGQAAWNAKNDAGESVVSGLYLFVIDSGQDVKRGKLVIIK